MRYLAIIILLSSCSAQYHLNKAIKKGYKCEETGDTIIKYNTVYVPKTRLEKKIEYKLKVKTIYKDRIVEKAQAKATRPKTRGNLSLLFVGVAIGLLLSYLFKFVRERYMF